MSRNPLYSLLATPAYAAPLYLRMALAAVFFYHGTQKAFGWFGGDGWSRTLALWSELDGVHLPGPIIAAIIVGELLIAASLFLGFFTRLGGLGVFFIMAGALYYVHGGTTFAAVEYPLVLMACGIALVCIGGGKFSVDRGISSNLLPGLGDEITR